MFLHTEKLGMAKLLKGGIVFIHFALIIPNSLIFQCILNISSTMVCLETVLLYLSLTITVMKALGNITMQEYMLYHSTILK